jgi:hypothetical protein
MGRVLGAQNADVLLLGVFGWAWVPQIVGASDREPDPVPAKILPVYPVEQGGVDGKTKAARKKKAVHQPKAK